jgi:Cu+-exporting ATPase
MELEIANYTNLTLAHQLKRRIRIVSPALKNDLERCYILEILLKKRPEIKRIRSVFSIGSIVIDFDPSSLPKKNNLILLDAVLGNIAKKE